MKILRSSEEEEMKEIVRYLNESCDEGAVILVEGVSDRKALLERGVKGKIITLHEFLRNFKTDIKGLKLITLLDLDREGENILRRIEEKYSTLLRLDNSARMRLRMTQRYKRGLRTIHQIFMPP
ncbi:MAG: hypothetical protein QW059_00250 [Nitrososphaerota archaeon]